MKLFSKLFFFCCMLFPALHISAVYGQYGKIKGKVIDTETGRAVGYASVLNYSTKVRLYSKQTGEFIIDAAAGDTLVFFAMGYYYQKVLADREMIAGNQATIISMKQQVYEIAEARILGFGTYEQFKQQFVQLNRAKTKTEMLNETFASVSRNVAVEAYNKAKADQKINSGSVTATLLSIPILTPDERERIALARIEEREQVYDQIYQKFNPTVVKHVTGLTDDDEIIEFMIFCKFSDKYLLEVGNYNLMENIAGKYELFKKKKAAEKSMQNRIDGQEADFIFLT
jgi:hypothetical protein